MRRLNVRTAHSRWSASCVAALAALAVTPVLLVSPARAGASSDRCLGLGISSNYQWAVNAPNAATDVPKLRADGVTSVREDIFWQVVQPNASNEWQWGQYDRLFMNMAHLGERVLPIIGYGTTWSSPNGEVKDIPNTPAGRSAYAQYAAAVVTRYGPGGQFWQTHRELKALPITAVELWNEPWYSPAPSATDYVALVRAAGAAVRHVSRTTKIAVNVDYRWTHLKRSPTPYWGQAVLRYAKSLAPYVDRWAIHPYSEGQWTGLAPAADSMRQINWLRQQLAAAHAKGNIWITELGYSTALPPTSSADYGDYQAPSTAYAAFIRAVARTKGPNPVTWIALFTSSRPYAGTRPGSWDYGYNLVSANGRVSSAVATANAARCA